MTRLDEIKLNKSGFKIGQDIENNGYYKANGFEYEIGKCYSSFYYECSVRKEGEKKFIKLCTRANINTCITKLANYIKENS